MPNGRWPGDIEEAFGRIRREFQGFKLGPILAAVVIFILLWSSWYTVQPEETAVVQRFGRVARTAGPGLHFKIPLGIETARLVPTARVLKEEFGF